MPLGPNACQDLERAAALEWLETNARAGCASGTVAGVNTRRQHGLLLVARDARRIVLVNQLEAWVDTPRGSFPLTSTRYAGATHPEGYRHAVAFDDRPCPTWTLEAGGVRVVREVLMPRGRDAVIVRFRLDGAVDGPVRIRARPMLTCRAYDALRAERDGMNAAEFRVSDGAACAVAWSPRADAPRVHAFATGPARYEHRAAWYRDVAYGPDREAWFSPGEFTLELTGARPAALLAFGGDDDVADAATLFDVEIARRNALLATPSSGDALFDRLRGASEAFRCETERGAFVVAGYPSLAVSTRDAFAALPGVCLVAGDHEFARRAIVALSAPYADASLWFVHAAERYLRYTGDVATVRRVALPAVRALLEGLRAGAHAGLAIDPADGLVKCDDAGPRAGKPVELQALWVRALDAAGAMAATLGERAMALGCAQEHDRAVASFARRFWYERGGYLYDVVDGPSGDDARLRPEQLYALALSDALVPRERALRALGVVRERLLVPAGLRASDEELEPRTASPRLLGPFARAWVRAHGHTDEARRTARGFFDGLVAGVEREGCIGQLGDARGGDVAHAWSTGEVLVALAEVVMAREP